MLSSAETIPVSSSLTIAPVGQTSRHFGMLQWRHVASEGVLLSGNITLMRDLDKSKDPLFTAAQANSQRRQPVHRSGCSPNMRCTFLAVGAIVFSSVFGMPGICPSCAVNSKLPDRPASVIYVQGTRLQKTRGLRPVRLHCIGIGRGSSDSPNG